MVNELCLVFNTAIPTHPLKVGNAPLCFSLPFLFHRKANKHMVTTVDYVEFTDTPRWYYCWPNFYIWFGTAKSINRIADNISL
jgi:hypothetical protein